MPNDFDDNDPFAAAMRKVRPLSQQNKHINHHAKQVKARDIVRERTTHTPSTSTISHKKHAPDQQHEPWTLRASGVSATVIRRLAAGQPPVAITLDLHGQYRDAALRQLQQTITQACLDGRRVVRVIHGRGMHSSDKPVLKQAVYHDLQYGSCASRILAAIPELGTRGGACLVLLRREK